MLENVNLKKMNRQQRILEAVPRHIRQARGAKCDAPTSR